MHLDAMNLKNTIKEGNATTNREKVKATIFLRHRIHEDLMLEYLTIKDPHILWNKLKETNDNLKLAHLPQVVMILKHKSL